MSRFLTRNFRKLSLTVCYKPPLVPTIFSQSFYQFSTDTENSENIRHNGFVKYFDFGKGNGRIVKEDDQSELFFHKTEIVTVGPGFASIENNQPVEFSIAATGLRRALKVTKPNGEPFEAYETKDHGKNPRAGE